MHCVLAHSSSEEDARSSLIKNISGIGLKEASHFLRNIGYSKKLAIIDTHIISFLTKINALNGLQIKSVTPRIYLELEDILKELCEERGLLMATFDMAVWNYMRKRN